MKKKNNFILYLDIDGVILPDFYENPPFYTITNLHILLSFSPLIVLSSDWRYSGVEYVEKTFEKWGIALSIWDTTPLYTTYNKKRGEEISEHKKNFPLLPYLILDDLDEGMEEHTSSFVYCNPREGLVDNKLQKALNIISSFSV